MGEEQPHLWLGSRDKEVGLTHPCPPLLVTFSTIRIWVQGCTTPRLPADRKPFLRMYFGHRDPRMKS